jgi:hypothetical protein
VIRCVCELFHFWEYVVIVLTLSAVVTAYLALFGLWDRMYMGDAVYKNKLFRRLAVNGQSCVLQLELFCATSCDRVTKEMRCGSVGRRATLWRVTI